MSRDGDCLNADGSVKLAYRSKARAEAMARKTGKKRLNDGPNHAYLCPACGKFHVGHVDPIEPLGETPPRVHA